MLLLNLWRRKVVIGRRLIVASLRSWWTVACHSLFIGGGGRLEVAKLVGNRVVNGRREVGLGGRGVLLHRGLFGWKVFLCRR